MLGRKSKTAVVEREVASAGSRAVEVVGEAASDFAERAVAAAQNAQRVAAPVLRTAAERSAETLSHAAERAAVVLADTAERLAETGEEKAAQASVVARTRLADASEALAQAVRPRRRRRLRRLVALGVIGGAVVAVFRSPLRTKLTDRLFGAPPEFEDDAPESITLPTTAPPVETGQRTPENTAAEKPAGESENGSGAESNGVTTGSTSSTGESATS